MLIRLQPKRFPPGTDSKLHAWRGDPFKFLQKLGVNAYLIDLPAEFQSSHIFNIEDLTTYHGPTSLNDEKNAPSTIPHVSPIPKIVKSIFTHQFQKLWILF